MTLPPDPNGYAVDRANGAVHSRNAAHARHLPKTRTVDGALSHLDFTAPVPCPECFPAPKAIRARAPAARRPSSTRKRSTSSKSKPRPTRPASIEEGA